MENVYDIRYQKNLIYILDETGKMDSDIVSDDTYKNTAIIVYLYYRDTLPFYYPYLEKVREKIDVYVISSNEDVIQSVRDHMESTGVGQNFTYLLKTNQGRDVSALLVTATEIVKRYKYVCFLHDKKEHRPEMKQEVELWKWNLWENLVSSPSYIDQILALLEKNEALGVLAPPEPIGDHFAAWYACGWYGSFEITKELARALQLKANLTKEKPPITLGTVLWFKTGAIKKLFDKGWNYEDFDDNKLKSPNYLSYGVERIFAYVAQDAGYDTANVMTIEYARVQSNYLQYSVNQIFKEVKDCIPFPTVSNIKRYVDSKKQIIEFLKKNKNIYLYGNGERAKSCCFFLIQQNVLPKGYIVTQKENKVTEGSIPVYALAEFQETSDVGIIITVEASNARKEIRENLERAGIYNYIQFME